MDHSKTAEFRILSESPCASIYSGLIPLFYWKFHFIFTLTKRRYQTSWLLEYLVISWGGYVCAKMLHVLAYAFPIAVSLNLCFSFFFYVTCTERQIHIKFAIQRRRCVCKYLPTTVLASICRRPPDKVPIPQVKDLQGSNVRDNPEKRLFLKACIIDVSLLWEHFKIPIWKYGSSKMLRRCGTIDTKLKLSEINVTLRHWNLHVFTEFLNKDQIHVSRKTYVFSLLLRRKCLCVRPYILRFHTYLISGQAI